MVAVVMYAPALKSSLCFLVDSRSNLSGSFELFLVLI